MGKFIYLIIGGGIAGTTAAETIRQKDPEGSMAIVSDEPHRLYSRILLSKPNFFLEKIPFEKIWLKTKSWYAENSIELICGRKAIKLDPQKKTVVLNDGTEIGYDKLLLAIGGCARQWVIPGSEKEGVFYLRTLDDAQNIIAAVKHAKQAVCIGGGFVSFEMCEMLRLAGIEVTLLLRESYYWEPLLDETSGKLIEEALQKGGVRILRNAEVNEVLGKEKVEGVILKDGIKLSCDMIIVGIGVFCPFDWLNPVRSQMPEASAAPQAERTSNGVKETGLEMSRGIVANEYLETSLPNVWTAGDAAEFTDLILGERVQLGNWVNAQRQGKIAGLNMAGGHEPFRMVSFYTTQGFGITIAFVGDVRIVPDRLIINRGQAASGSYGRIIAKGGEIVGATLINRTKELGAVSRLIEKDIKIAGREKELGDHDFDLKTLL